MFSSRYHDDSSAAERRHASAAALVLTLGTMAVDTVGTRTVRAFAFVAVLCGALTVAVEAAPRMESLNFQVRMLRTRMWCALLLPPPPAQRSATRLLPSWRMASCVLLLRLGSADAVCC